MSGDETETFEKKTNFSIRIVATVSTPPEVAVQMQGFEFQIKTPMNGVKRYIFIYVSHYKANQSFATFNTIVCKMC